MEYFCNLNTTEDFSEVIGSFSEFHNNLLVMTAKRVPRKRPIKRRAKSARKPSRLKGVKQKRFRKENIIQKWNELENQS